MEGRGGRWREGRTIKVRDIECTTCAHDAYLPIAVILHFGVQMPLVYHLESKPVNSLLRQAGWEGGKGCYTVLMTPPTIPYFMTPPTTDSYN